MSQPRIDTPDDWTIIEAVIPGEEDPNILASTSQQDDWEPILAENNISAIPSLNESSVNLNTPSQETTSQQRQSKQEQNQEDPTTPKAEGNLSRACPVCTLLNHTSLSHCEACDNKLDPSTEDSSNDSPPHKRLIGCHQCTFMNPWGEELCHMCESVLF